MTTIATTENPTIGNAQNAAAVTAQPVQSAHSAQSAQSVESARSAGPAGSASSAQSVGTTQFAETAMPTQFNEQARFANLQALHDADRTLVMGVLNITADSFSDGGLWLDPQKAAKHGADMMADGADIIDIGAESTRPGAQRIDAETEKQRVLGAVKALLPQGAVLSIDTTRASVAQAALEAGAQIINDVSGGQLDPDMARVVRDHDCLYIMQHWRGWLAGSHSGTPDQDTSYYEHGVLADVTAEMRRQLDALTSQGVDIRRIITDPGLGFSKPTPDHNMPLLAGLDQIKALGCPVLIGQSRKRFINGMLQELPWREAANDALHQADLDNATAAISALCAEHGAWAVRVHDVRRSVAAVRMGAVWRQATQELAR